MLRVLALVLMAGVSLADVRPDAPFLLVVNRSSAVTTLRREEVSAIFMKRTRSWRDGTEIVPIDRPARSPLRERFSRSIHGKSVAFVTRYWQRLIFAGRAVPPQEAPTDAAVLALVQANRGAIGYIDAATPPGDAVKVIAVTP